MKKFVFLVIAVCALSFVQAQSNVQPIPAVANSGAEAISLKETEFDFGPIPQGKPVYHTFEVVNNTNAPLKLDNVQASCGCTTPQWNKEPIPAGGTAKINVGYNAAGEG